MKRDLSFFCTGDLQHFLLNVVYALIRIYVENTLFITLLPEMASSTDERIWACYPLYMRNPDEKKIITSELELISFSNDLVK